MCGIAGIMAFDGKKISTSELKKMTECMVHRGPDDDGFFTFDSVGLGMRRLSIFDVEGGHQPLSNEDGDLKLVLNGEIYNHVELRQQLIARGHVFRTGSDAEVVLHLYEEKGVDALAELNGMFAFALYDSHRKALWIGRDRIGIKPLFYAMDHDRIVFASDAKAIRSVYKTNIESQQILKYLALGYVSGEETLWQGVTKLPPGHYLWIENDKVKLQKYWSLDRIGNYDIGIEEAHEKLDFLLHDAINLQLRSDVPLGAFSSGGVDSSSLVALASKKLPEALKTFTICFKGKNSADADFAKKVAHLYGTTHLQVPMGALEATEALDELLPKLDEPIADSAILPSYIISKIAREQGIKVLLNGAGGDEIFGGYTRHFPPRFGSPSWVAENLPNSMRQVVSSVWSLFQPYRSVRASDPVLAWGASISGVNFHSSRKLLRDPGAYTNLLSAIKEEYKDLISTSAGHGYTYDRMLIDYQKYLPQDVLSLTDKATMSASVEGRVPLLDHRLVELAFSLPAEVNLYKGQAKGLFKRVMLNDLPEDLINRKKEGFSSPDAVWLSDDKCFNLAEELLEAKTPLFDEIINPSALEKLLNSREQRKHSASLLFALYLFNRWHRMH